MAAAATGGELLLKNTIPEHVRAVIHVARECGCEIKNTALIRVSGPEGLVPLIRSDFRTDFNRYAAPGPGIMTTAHGTSIIVETVFKTGTSMLKSCSDGREYKVEGRIAIIKGVRKWSEQM